LEELEILLLLREEPARWFEAPEVTAALRLGAYSAPERLARLARRGLLEVAGVPLRYRYAPDPLREPVIAAAARCHAECRHLVIASIYAPSPRRSRPA
ncbi:MAG TPA: hypothetical protein VIR81_02555, partial [Myxococcales bacterium]